MTTVANLPISSRGFMSAINQPQRRMMEPKEMRGSIPHAGKGHLAPDALIGLSLFAVHAAIPHARRIWLAQAGL